MSWKKRLHETFPTIRSWIKSRQIDFFPLRKTLRSYTPAQRRADAKAAVNVALLDFPQAMAYALMAGLPVQAGLYASALGSLVGPALASSRFVMLGTTNATAVLLLSTFLTLEIPPEERVALLPLLLFMVASILVVAAVLRLAVFLRYVSRTVLTGYITAAALLIIVNQTKGALGLVVPSASSFVDGLFTLLGGLFTTNLWALQLSLLTAAIYLAFERWAKRLPTIALTLVGVTGLVWLVELTGADLWASVPGVPAGVWPFTLPTLDFQLISQLANSAFALAFLAILESVSIAKTTAARAGDRVDVNQQMLSVGVANLVSGIGGGTVVSGSLARSTLNQSSGAQTPLSSVFSGIILVVGILAAGPLIGLIPKAALSTLVIFVGLKLIEPQKVMTVVRATKADATVFWMTFGGALLFPLDTAIYLGVAVSIILFLHKVSTPELVEYAFTNEGELALAHGEKKTVPEVSIVHVEGDLFFGSTEIFTDQMRLLMSEPNLKVVILRLRNARHLDATAALAVGELVRFAREKGRDVILSGALPEVEEVCRNTGIYQLVGAENFYPNDADNPNLSTRQALKRAQKIMGIQQANIRLYAKAQPAASAESAAPAAATPTATAATPPSPSAS